MQLHKIHYSECAESESRTSLRFQMPRLSSCFSEWDNAIVSQQPLGGSSVTDCTFFLIIGEALLLG